MPAYQGMPLIILASASPRREELLRQMGLNFQAIPSRTSELHPEELTAQEAAQVNAYRKARSLAKKYPDALVIGADTLVCLGLKLFGKPADLEQAYVMLEQLQGKTHRVVTAICLLCLRQHRQRVFTDHTDVTFKPLDASAIRRYLNRVNPLDKAGAYGIQESGELIIERVNGSYNNVVGLPTERLRFELHQWAAETDAPSPLPFVAAMRPELPGQSNYPISP